MAVSRASQRDAILLNRRSVRAGLTLAAFAVPSPIEESSKSFEDNVRADATLLDDELALPLSGNDAPTSRFEPSAIEEYEKAAQELRENAS